jgi:hypothetical protein
MKSLFVTILMSILFCSYSRACDCDKERSPVQELLQSSKAVFTGTVISTKDSSFKDSSGSRTLRKMVLRIDKMIKGDSKKEIAVFTEYMDCGQLLRKGKKYLVYTYEHCTSGLLIMHQCHSPCPEINSELAKQDLEEIKKL